MTEEELQMRIIGLFGKLERGEIEAPTFCIMCCNDAETSPRRFGQDVAWVCRDCDPIYEAE